MQAMISASRPLLAWLPALPLAAVFAVAFVLPLAALVWISLYTSTDFTTMGLDQYVRFFSEGFTLRILGDTMMLGAQVATLCLILGYPLALVYAAASARVKTLMIFLVLLPLLTSTVVRTFAWIVILGREGIINSAMMGMGMWQEPARLLYTWAGLVIALAQIQLPLMALPLFNSFTQLDSNLVRAAEGLGANRWRILITVIVPLTLPGALAGWILVFAAASTAFITQTLVGGGRIVLMPNYIYQQTVGAMDWTFAAALSLILTVAVMAMVLAIGAVTRHFVRGSHAA